MIDKNNLTTGFLRAIHRQPALRVPEYPLPSEKFAKEAYGGVEKDAKQPILITHKPAGSHGGSIPMQDIGTPVFPPGISDSYRVVISVSPMGKPRMTQQDKWKKRPAVVKYREWCDEVRRQVVDYPDSPVSVSWVAYFPMPSSWSKKKKASMRGMAHRSKPDRDNCDKALLDCLWKDDSVISGGSLLKLWDDGSGPRIELEVRT